MLTSSPAESSTSSFTDSPISQHPPVHVWPSLPRARRPEAPKAPRYYATPLRDDSPESTPTQIYGLEEREPSICERPKLMHRFSHALGDIKEDFSLQLDPRTTSEKLRSSRRLSTYVDSPTASPPSSSPTGLPRTSAGWSLLGVPMDTALPRPGSSSRSFLSPETPARRLTRRLSASFNFSSRRRTLRAPPSASISQPNLIGSSTQI